MDVDLGPHRVSDVGDGAGGRGGAPGVEGMRQNGRKAVSKGKRMPTRLQSRVVEDRSLFITENRFHDVEISLRVWR